LGCLLLSLLLQWRFTLNHDTLTTLDQDLKEDKRSGWKELTAGIEFSNSSLPQKKPSPPIRKRDKPTVSNAEDGIAQKLSRKRKEQLDYLVNEDS